MPFNAFASEGTTTANTETMSNTADSAFTLTYFCAKSTAIASFCPVSFGFVTRRVTRIGTSLPVSGHSIVIPKPAKCCPRHTHSVPSRSAFKL